MTKELVFITVLGKDQKGIIARVSGALFKHSINIEDVNQKIWDGYFVMTMFVDISGSTKTIGELKIQTLIRSNQIFMNGLQITARA